MSGAGGTGGDNWCAKFTKAATQQPAAMLFVLDASASMKDQNKWGAAQGAVASAIDANAFDSMSLGISTFPSSFTDPPQCLCDYIDQMGGGLFTCADVFRTASLAAIRYCRRSRSRRQERRKRMHRWACVTTFTNTSSGKSPQQGDDSDASPIYDAMVGGYNALRNANIGATDKRILVLITDGGFSCASLSSPARPGYSDMACPDWEEPDTVNAMITAQRTDPSKPIFTFVVGVPGSDSTGGMQGQYATAPYNMRRALSSYAANGSPTTDDPTCDKPDATFNASPGAAPTKVCHFDLSGGQQFNQAALTDALAAIRGKALGCAYDLPMPPPGDTIDPGQVNVDVTLGGVNPR